MFISVLPDISNILLISELYTFLILRWRPTIMLQKEEGDIIKVES